MSRVVFYFHLSPLYPYP